MKDACIVNCAFRIVLSLYETLVDVTNGCCGLSWKDIFASLAAGILLRERSTGCIVHTDMLDGEGEPMPRSAFEDGNRGTRPMGFRRREIRHLAGGGQRRNGLAESPSVGVVVS